MISTQTLIDQKTFSLLTTVTLSSAVRGYDFKRFALILVGGGGEYRLVEARPIYTMKAIRWFLSLI